MGGTFWQGVGGIPSFRFSHNTDPDRYPRTALMDSSKSGLGFRVQGLGAWGLGFGVLGLGLRVLEGFMQGVYALAHCQRGTLSTEPSTREQSQTPKRQNSVPLGLRVEG